MVVKFQSAWSNVATYTANSPHPVQCMLQHDPIDKLRMKREDLGKDRGNHSVQTDHDAMFLSPSRQMAHFYVEGSDFIVK